MEPMWTAGRSWSSATECCDYKKIETSFHNELKKTKHSIFAGHSRDPTPFVAEVNCNYQRKYWTALTTAVLIVPGAYVFKPFRNIRSPAPLNNKQGSDVHLHTFVKRWAWELNFDRHGRSAEKANQWKQIVLKLCGNMPGYATSRVWLGGRLKAF